MHLLDNPHLHPDDVPLLRRKLSDILEREPYQEAELRIQKRDGAICGAVCVRRCRKTARVNRPKRWA